MVSNSWLRRAGSLVTVGGLSLSLIAGTLQAAWPEGREGRPGKVAREGRGGRLMAALETLNLSQEQKTKLNVLRARHREQVQELRRGNSDREARRSKMRELKAKHRAGVMAILTPKQREQLRAQMRKARAQRKAAWAKS